MLQKSVEEGKVLCRGQAADNGRSCRPAPAGPSHKPVLLGVCVGGQRPPPPPHAPPPPPRSSGNRDRLPGGRRRRRGRARPAAAWGRGGQGDRPAAGALPVGGALPAAALPSRLPFTWLSYSAIISLSFLNLLGVDIIHLLLPLLPLLLLVLNYYY